MLCHRLLRVTLALSASVLFANAESAVLFVANNTSFNGTGCGARERPCRSISQAVRNAADGDQIEVGPGIYGDINGDLNPFGPGEEATITIDKSLEIYSTAGAALTVFKAPHNFDGRMVIISASGVTFGRLNGGFTLAGHKTAPNVNGTAGIDGGGVDTTDVTIAGNIFIGNEAGMGTSGSRIHIEGNAAIDNAQTGFQVFGTDNVVVNNVASGNATGFVVGFARLTFTDNAAIGNVVGIEVNTEFDNELIGNTVLGNSRTGFWFRQPPQSGARLVIHNTNIYGNGDAADGCGVINEGGGAIDATNNYWGKADGPGPNPGDRAFGVCQVRGSIVTAPFATVAFPTGEQSSQ